MLKRKPKELKFCASTILGAKSLAYQEGIPPERQPCFCGWISGQWTLIYSL